MDIPREEIPSTDVSSIEVTHPLPLSFPHYSTFYPCSWMSARASHTIDSTVYVVHNNAWHLWIKEDPNNPMPSDHSHARYQLFCFGF